ncbi:hypothetical protein JW851_03185 [Candidatus Woesearchaeota archaeon]|nr:hypothetical protein [Candidatus Woesearchaeota archaeon]
MKKRGLLILLSILLLIIVIGCSKAPEVPDQAPVKELTSEEASTFKHSLPNIRDAVTSTFGSLNIFFNDFITAFDAKKVMLSIDSGVVSKIESKASNAKQTIDNIDLIVSDFNKKKAGITLGGSDASMSEEIASKLDLYSTNKAKITSCVNSMETYSKFITLTVEREDLIKTFTLNMEKAGNEVDKEKFDNSITYGKKAKTNLQRIKAIDLERSKMGIVDISADVLMSWDLHLEAMDVLLSLWNDLKADNMNAAMEKAQQHYNIFSRANKYGEKEPPVADQATTANVWLNSNIGVCKGLV